ncbi:MAG: sugar-binding domain-containing protein [Amaricoccus sp.]|uniref:sugar-binding transcriptional regulator n=1 Tax=Amaricoccus sp. TaxID=1872485 RepID=UPI0039E34784
MTGRPAARPLGDASSQRLRAAWLYHNRGMTQKQVADALGLSRATVIRMIEDGLRASEVQVWINEDPKVPVRLAIALEETFGLAEAVVVPGAADATRAVGAALGDLLSITLADGMTVGVGWGRTLHAALPHVTRQRRDGMQVVSLLGGLVTPGAANPAEFAWRLAGMTGAGCHLLLSPLFVDSADTKDRLFRACGLGNVIAMAGRLDVAVVSCGDPRVAGGSLATDHLGPELRAELVARGAVADVISQFLDAEGRTIDHPIRHRVMSTDLGLVANARHVVLAAGGAAKAVSIRAALRRFPGCTLVTDETAARVLIELDA